MGLTMRAAGRTAGATRCAMEATEQAKTLANTHRESERELIILLLLNLNMGGWSWTFLERDPRNPEELLQMLEKEWQGEAGNSGKAGRFGLNRPRWSPNSS